MKAELSLVKLWSDEDMVELLVEVSDGASRFVNKVYAGHRHLKDTVTGYWSGSRITSTAASMTSDSASSGLNMHPAHSMLDCIFRKEEGCTSP